jgi:alkanesulfonate monooxygenase SsuD/methylene tetrahydromethanopterin reductase-like flavin-dependent oxidoreductase (luciferase family)
MDVFPQQPRVSITGRMFVFLRFSIIIHLSGLKAQWDSFANFATQAEALGYDSIWVSDHLMSPTGSPRAFEAWTTVSALSQLTRRMRLGTYVLCNQFRHPSMLAKMAATLDNISEGRLDLGLGAGWFIGEHLTFGFEWYTHFNRIKRLRETLEVVKRLWTEDNVT